MKTFFIDLVTFIGRVALSLIFLLSGLSKIGDYAGNVAFMQAKGILFAPFFLYAAVLIELLGAFSLITGYRARMGSLMLALFLIPTTYVFHYVPAFTSGFTVSEQKIQMISLMKNISIFGGLLMVFGNGAGKWKLGKD